MKTFRKSSITSASGTTVYSPTKNRSASNRLQWSNATKFVAIKILFFSSLVIRAPLSIAPVYVWVLQARIPWMCTELSEKSVMRTKKKDRFSKQLNERKWYDWENVKRWRRFISGSTRSLKCAMRPCLFNQFGDCAIAAYVENYRHISFYFLVASAHPVKIVHRSNKCWMNKWQTHWKWFACHRFKFPIRFSMITMITHSITPGNELQLQNCNEFKRRIHVDAWKQ